MLSWIINRPECVLVCVWLNISDVCLFNGRSYCNLLADAIEGCFFSKAATVGVFTMLQIQISTFVNIVNVFAQTGVYCYRRCANTNWFQHQIEVLKWRKLTLPPVPKGVTTKNAITGS